MYSPDLQPLAGVDVVLDNVRHSRTDSSGRFRFDDVPYGRHRVEARYVSEQPTFFTTPSPAEVETGASVHFGIALARSSLRGVVLTDAGIGVSGVLVHIAAADRPTTVRTGDDGTFVAEGLAAGDYDVTIEAGSVPVGYPVDTLAPERVRVEQTAPGRVRFVLRPYRSVGGRARLFNRETGQYVALARASVELQPLRRQSVTDANGQYAFRDVPPGKYTIVAKHDGREHLAAVSVPDGPAFVKDMDLAVIPVAAVLAGAGSPRGGTGDRRTVLRQAGEDRAQIDEGGSAKAARPAATSGLFAIQVAESTSARHAQAMVNELKSAGHPAYLVEPDRSGLNGPYHVRVGHYSTVAEANRSARTLEKAIGWRMSVTAAPPDFAVRGKAVSYVK
jgi:hypothetical protein